MFDTDGLNTSVLYSTVNQKMIVVVELYVAGRFITELGSKWCSTECVTLSVVHVDGEEMG